jgi:hypothetical protein
VTDAADGGIADRGGGRGSYRVIEINAGQILQRAHSSLRRALSPTFRAGSDAAHYPLAGVGAADSGAVLLDRREPPIFLFSKFRCGPIDGARAVRATGSLHIGAGRERTGRGGLRRAFALRFRAGGWCSLSLGALAPAADRHTVDQQTDPLAPPAGRGRRVREGRIDRRWRRRCCGVSRSSSLSIAATYGVVVRSTPIATAR